MARRYNHPGLPKRRPAVTIEENEEIRRLRAESRRLREDVAIRVEGCVAGHRA